MENRTEDLNTNMNLENLIKILKEITKEVGHDTEVWLSSDEEGNEFLPMSSKEEFSIGVDTNNKRVILFPIHL